MGLSASTVFEVRTTGADTAGGGFVAAGTNLLTNGAATAANTSAPVFTSASYTFGAGDVGAWVYIDAGTNWAAGWYKINAVAAGAATLEGTIGLAVLKAGTPSTAAGCATVASPTSATWTIDRSQQDAAAFTGTDLAVDGTTNTKVTSAGHTFTAVDVGNLIQISAGTGYTTGFYQVVSVAGGAATLDRSPAAVSTTGGTWALGGALASPGKAAGSQVAGNTVWVKAGTYGMTSSTVNVSGGVLSLLGQASRSAWTLWEGYQVTRGTLGTKPLFQASGISTTQMVLLNAQGTRFRNFEIDAASLTTMVGIKGNGNPNYGVVERCLVRNCTNGGIVQGTSAALLVYLCEVTGCSGAGAGINLSGANLPSGEACAVHTCYIHDNTVTGVAAGLCVHTISVNNTGAGSDGFFGCANMVNCVAYGNGRSGFRPDHNNSINEFFLINCVAVNNGEYGFNGHGSIPAYFTQMYNCAAYNNTSGAYNAAAFLMPVQGFVTLTADPFTNAAGGDFSLNNTAGGGKACRAAGIPGAFPGLPNTMGYLDIGAVQSRGSGGTKRRVWGN